MSEIVRYGLILALVCIVASGLLAGVYSLTKARIIAQALAEEQASLQEVVPEAVKFIPVKSDGQTLYYEAHNQEGKIVAFAFKAVGKGYSSPIETMAGIEPDGTITFIKILSHNETPGIGARIGEGEFISRFTQQNDFRNVQAITGATISSKAVIESVKKKAEEIQALFKDNPKHE